MMESDERPTSYSVEEAREILALPAALDNRATHFGDDDLTQMARELSISTQALARAKATYRAVRAEREQQLNLERAAFERSRRKWFDIHSIIFAVVSYLWFMAMLLLSAEAAYEMMGPMLPIIVWSVILLAHYGLVQQAEGPVYEWWLARWRAVSRENKVSLRTTDGNLR